MFASIANHVYADLKFVMASPINGVVSKTGG